MVFPANEKLKLKMMLRAISWLMLCAGLWAQGPGAPDPSTLGRIEGRAINAVTGESLRKTTVGIHGGTSDYTATSDGAGHFVIERIAPGSYTLTAEHQNFAMLNYGSNRPEHAGTLLTLSAGQSMTGIELKLVPFGVISGKVTDQDGDPVTGVPITVMHWVFMRGSRQLQAAGGGASTNDRGEFRIYNLAAGHYYLVARPVRSEMMMTDANTMRRMPARTEAPEAYISTYYPSAPDVAAATQVTLTAGLEIPGLDIQLRRSRVHSIQGKISGLHTGHRYSISLMQQDSSSSANFGMGRAAAVRPDDGSFVFRGVTAGRYVLYVMADNRMMGRQEIAMADSDVEGMVIPAMEPGGIKGRVLVEGNPAKPPNLKGMRISLTPVDGIVMNLPNANTGADGTFSIDEVPADRYRVNCTALDGTYLKTIRWSGQVSNDGTVEMIGGGSALLELAFTPTTAAIDGDVKTDDDQPSPGTRILLVPSSGRETDFRAVAADANGHFSFKGVAPGSYTALATDGAIYGMLDGQLLKALEKVTTAVSVDENGHTTTSLKLVPESAIEALQ